MTIRWFAMTVRWWKVIIVFFYSTAYFGENTYLPAILLYNKVLIYSYKPLFDNLANPD